MLSKDTASNDREVTDICNKDVNAHLYADRDAHSAALLTSQLSTLSIFAQLHNKDTGASIAADIIRTHLLKDDVLDSVFQKSY